MVADVMRVGQDVSNGANVTSFPQEMVNFKIESPDPLSA